MQTQFKPRAGLMLVLLLFGLLLSACQPIQPISAEGHAITDAEQDAFIATAMALEQAYQDEDLEAVIAFYADDAISHAPSFPSDVGKEAIKIAYQSYFDAYDLQRDFKLTEVDMSTDFATRTGEWTQVLTPTDGSDSITEIGRCILGWKKVDGEWKVAWEIWNTYDAPPQ